MPIAAINSYLEQLDARIAEHQLIMADSASIPHMEKHARNRTLRAWAQTAKRQRGEAGIVVSPARLHMLGIGVKRHKKGNEQ